MLGGGALFAAFPLVYASLFSGFYFAMMLVLLVLILRTVAVEFRSKRESPRWRSGWDWVFFGSSLGIALLLGVALGNVIRGVPIDDQGNTTINFTDLLNPYSLVLGLAGLVMLALHGGIYLILKVDGPVADRARALIPRLMVATFVLITLVIAWTLLLPQAIPQNFQNRLWLGIFPLLALLAALYAWRQINAGRYLIAFFSSSAMIGLLIATVGAGLYPVLLPSSTDSAYDLTVYNAASAQPTLMVMLVIAVIGMPFVLLYTAGVYYFFRGKVVLDQESY